MTSVRYGTGQPEVPRYRHVKAKFLRIRKDSAARWVSIYEVLGGYRRVHSI